jgi:hypothetical protein
MCSANFRALTFRASSSSRRKRPGWRRFVQEGEVPVTVLNGRRTSPTDAPVNRLEAVETAVAAERAARERAERARAEAQATIHDLQTKLGRANLTQTDLQTAAQRDQDAAIAARAELRATNERLAATEAVRETLQQRLSAVEEARTARQQADRARRDAEVAQADAERRLRTLDPTAGQAADRPVHQPKTTMKPWVGWRYSAAAPPSPLCVYPGSAEYDGAPCTIVHECNSLQT